MPTDNRIARTLSVMLVDDEPLARDNLRLLLAADAQVGLPVECSNGYEALDRLRTHAIDVMFLDIQMPEMSGLEVLAAVPPEKLPVVVFVTAYDRYAIHAFNASALDYLLKPVDEKRFYESLERAKASVYQREALQLAAQFRTLLENYAPPKPDEPPRKESYLQRIAVKSSLRTLIVAVDNLMWVEADDYYVKLHTLEKTHLLRQTLTTLEAQLDPQYFQRIHRSAIVNLRAIRELQPHSSGDALIVLHDGTQLKLSRTHRKQVQKHLLGLI
ncbi:MAG: response regulator transcription factor [Rhizobacter sp.]|nr:response regulator transcription factor [Chlorobiales bacterium]